MKSKQFLKAATIALFSTSAFVYSEQQSDAHAQKEIAQKPVAKESKHVLALGTGVKDRELQNPKDDFSTNDGQVFAHLTLSPSTDGTVTFVWSKNGVEQSKFEAITKNSSRYRVFSFIHASEGNWTVKILRDEEKEPLLIKEFKIAAGHARDTDHHVVNPTTHPKEPTTQPVPSQAVVPSPKEPQAPQAQPVKAPEIQKPAVENPAAQPIKENEVARQAEKPVVVEEPVVKEKDKDVSLPSKPLTTSHEPLTTPPAAPTQKPEPIVKPKVTATPS